MGPGLSVCVSPPVVPRTVQSRRDWVSRNGPLARRGPRIGLPVARPSGCWRRRPVLPCQLPALADGWPYGPGSGRRWPCPIGLDLKVERYAESIGDCILCEYVALYATYYPVAKGALARLDPWIFMTLAELLTLPVAFALLWRARRLSTQTVASGIVLGVISNLAFVAGLQALRFTSATNTTFLGALSGVLGALIARILLGQRLHPLTWLAGVLSVIGAAGLVFEGGWAGLNIGDLVAFWRPVSTPGTSSRRIARRRSRGSTPVGCWRWCC